ncbi:hypothetical protein, partial [Streptomyces sp. NPDC048155]|uniref:hypothetical protein n=1 Tax=Streptomyces sp. NPDC048155 TaxID=3154818 RepID=UPI0033F1E840
MSTSIVVHRPSPAGGRRVTVGDEIAGLAHGDRDLVEFLSLDPPRWVESGLLIGLGSGGRVRAGCVRWSA